MTSFEDVMITSWFHPICPPGRRPFRTSRGRQKRCDQDIIRMCLQVDLTPPSGEKVILNQIKSNRAYSAFPATECNTTTTTFNHWNWHTHRIRTCVLRERLHRFGWTCTLQQQRDVWPGFVLWSDQRLCTVEVITQFACVGSLGLIMGVLAMELCLTLAS